MKLSRIFLASQSSRTGFLSMFNVVSVMALATKRPQVGRVAVLRRVVEVGDGQHDPRGFSAFVRPFIGRCRVECPCAESWQSPGSIGHAALFAALTGAAEDLRADLLPVAGVAVAVFSFDRHRGDSAHIHTASARVNCSSSANVK